MDPSNPFAWYPPTTLGAGGNEYHLQQQMEMFWNNQRQKIEQVKNFKNQELSLNPIKRIIKADENVHFVAGEVLVLFSKACELFILELTTRSWFHTQENNRTLIAKKDIATAISHHEAFDFLIDIVPRIVEIKEPSFSSSDGILEALSFTGFPSSNYPMDPSSWLSLLQDPDPPEDEGGGGLNGQG